MKIIETEMDYVQMRYDSAEYTAQEINDNIGLTCKKTTVLSKV